MITKYNILTKIKLTTGTTELLHTIQGRYRCSASARKMKTHSSVDEGLLQNCALITNSWKVRICCLSCLNAIDFNKFELSFLQEQIIDVLPRSRLSSSFVFKWHSIPVEINIFKSQSKVLTLEWLSTRCNLEPCGSIYTSFERLEVVIFLFLWKIRKYT